MQAIYRVFPENNQSTDCLCKCRGHGGLRRVRARRNVETHMARAGITNSEVNPSYAITGHVAVRHDAA
jgi:hypothetical protein